VALSESESSVYVQNCAYADAFSNQKPIFIAIV
jgi:hypothetical protein